MSFVYVARPLLSFTFGLLRGVIILPATIPLYKKIGSGHDIKAMYRLAIGYSEVRNT